MKLIATFLAVFLIIASVPPLLNSQELDKKLHLQCLYPTIGIGHVNGNPRGSGVIVRSDKIEDNVYYNVFITCSHLFGYGDYTNYEVREYLYEDWSQVKGVKYYSCFICDINYEEDLAIGVFYSDKEMPIAKINLDLKIYIGNDLIRIGCGLGDEPRLDCGKATGYKKNSKESYIRTSIHTLPGDSGSPVFKDYEIVGIMVTIRTLRNVPIYGISYAVPINVFKTWSESKKNNLDYMFDKKKKLPVMPSIWLKFRDYDISIKKGD